MCPGQQVQHALSYEPRIKDLPKCCNPHTSILTNTEHYIWGSQKVHYLEAVCILCAFTMRLPQQ